MKRTVPTENGMCRVLIVADDKAARLRISAAVGRATHGCAAVTEAKNGEEGYAAALRLTPDLIVTDVLLPESDGFTMLGQLRAAGIDSAVVFLSAQNDFDSVRQALRLGAADYLLKPLNEGELEQTVARILPCEPQPGGEASDRLPALRPYTGSSKYVIETLAFLAAHYGESNLTIGRIADGLQISEGHLSHVFRRETGFTLVEYLAQYRMREATRLLGDVRLKIYEVAQAVGYRDIAYFSVTFRKFMGQTPSEYQNSH